MNTLPLSSEFYDRLRWMEGLVSSLRANEKSFLQELEALDSDPQQKAKVALALRAFVESIDWLDLFSECRFNQNRGFWSEAVDRLLHKIFPTTYATKNSLEILGKIFSNPNDPAWLEQLSRRCIAKVMELLPYAESTPGSTRKLLKLKLREGLLVLGARLSAFGGSRELRRRLPQLSLSESPFFTLSAHLNEIAVTLSTNETVTESQLLLFEAAQADIDRCLLQIKTLYDQLENYGVTISLVYALEGQSRNLRRVDTLLRLCIDHLPTVSRGIGVCLLAEGVRDAQVKRSLRELFNSNLHLLSRKIVERTGATGEHYITRDRTEYFKMMQRAMGGGLVTVGTTILKSTITHLGLIRFAEGCLVGLNYAFSFLLIQFSGFTLATKQPSMTASTLAGKLKDLDYRLNVDEFLDEVTRFSRSQFIAIVGNVGAAVPCGLLFAYFYTRLTGHPVFEEEYALYTIKGLNPLKSLTLFFAAFTGLILWISSICAGWTENWAVSRNLATSLSSHPYLERKFGRHRMHQFSHWFSHHINGMGANVSLGFLLSFVHIVGKATPLPLDVRHVTLSTVALVFSVASLGEVSLTAVLPAVLGIFCIGFLNVWVTFFLSLFIAARARQVRKGWLRFLVKQVSLRFLKNPLPFFFAPAK